LTFVDAPTEEGQKKDCPNCGKPMISRLKTYKDNKYPAKKQWQEVDDTKAHFDKDGGCVRTPTTETGSTQAAAAQTASTATTTETPKPAATKPAKLGAPKSAPVPTSLAKIPELDTEASAIVESEVIMKLMVRNHVEKFLKEFVTEPNGGMVTIWADDIFKKHFSVKFEKASEIKKD